MQDRGDSGEKAGEWGEQGGRWDVQSAGVERGKEQGQGQAAIQLDHQGKKEGFPKPCVMRPLAEANPESQSQHHQEGLQPSESGLLLIGLLQLVGA